MQPFYLFLENFYRHAMHFDHIHPPTLSRSTPAFPPHPALSLLFKKEPSESSVCFLSTPGCGAIHQSMVHLGGHILEVNELSWFLLYDNLKEKVLNLPYGFKGLESMMVERKNSREFTPSSITMRQRETLGIAWDFHTSNPTQQWCIFFSKATLLIPNSSTNLTGDQIAKSMS